VKVSFYGVRGSIPTSSYGKWSKFGGNTSCVHLHATGADVAFDAGTGIKYLGDALVDTDAGREGNTLAVFVSHFHWDHIQGFPFFRPAFDSSRRIILASGKPGLREALTVQQWDDFFPVPLDQMGASMEFLHLATKTPHTIGPLTVSCIATNHPGGAYSYRVEADGHSVVYLSDSELWPVENVDVDLYRRHCDGADMVILDAHFAPAELEATRGWGHSSIISFMELLEGCRIKQVVMYHYSPEYDDSRVEEILVEALKRKAQDPSRFPFDIVAAREGMTIDIGKPVRVKA
jgi:phosphoribosyl 1,2-cyclic phosphodiesterase